MKRYFLPFVLLLATVCSLSSCLGDEDNEIVYFDDAALTSFTLGTLNCYLHTTSKSGADSIYKRSVVGSNYKFYIDQTTREIYNPDSLPYGTDAAHVICNIVTKNGGQVALQRMTSDSLTWYNAADSIDFTQPRRFRVYSNRGTSSAVYTVHVNVHQQKADEFKWSLLKDQEQNIASTPKLRMAAAGSHALAFMQTSDKTSTVVMDLTKRLETGFDSDFDALELGPAAIDNVVTQGQRVLVLSDQRLYIAEETADGQLSWTHHADRPTEGITRLVGASSKELYALGTDGRLKASSDNGQTWTDEAMDDDKAMLPTDNFSCTVQALRSNPEVEHVVLIGTRDGQQQAEVWMKLVDNSENLPNGTWTRVEQSNNASLRLYAQQMLTVIPYDDARLAIGYGTDAFTPMLLSKDGGINWRKSSLYTFPTGFNSTAVFGATVDNQQNIWMVCGGSGQVWRGRLNRLGWATWQTAFTE